MTAIIDQWQDELVACIHFLHAKGFAPATSSNYSFRLPESGSIFISASGIDKGRFTKQDLMPIDAAGQPVNDPRKPSAETLLHTLIYKRVPTASCILHTHTIYNTALSGLLADAGKVSLEGFEVLKGLKGIKTHEVTVDVPIFANSQNMVELADEIKGYWENHPRMYGFLLAKHGLYTWGDSIAVAKRQIEVFEFLFECYYKMSLLSNR